MRLLAGTKVPPALTRRIASTATAKGTLVGMKPRHPASSAFTIWLGSSSSEMRTSGKCSAPFARSEICRLASASFMPSPVQSTTREPFIASADCRHSSTLRKASTL